MLACLLEGTLEKNSFETLIAPEPIVSLVEGSLSGFLHRGNMTPGPVEMYRFIKASIILQQGSLSPVDLFCRRSAGDIIVFLTVNRNAIHIMFKAFFFLSHVTLFSVPSSETIHFNVILYYSLVSYHCKNLFLNNENIFN